MTATEQAISAETRPAAPRKGKNAQLLSRIEAAQYLGIKLKTWDKAQERSDAYRTEYRQRVAALAEQGDTSVQAIERAIRDGRVAVEPRNKPGKKRAPYAPLPAQVHRRTKLYRLSDLQRYRRELEDYHRRQRAARS